MKEKIQLIMDLFEKGGNGKQVTILTLEICAELALKIEALEAENQKLRETVSIVAKGGKPVMSGGPGGFSIG